MPTIKLTGLSKQYDAGNWALRDVDLTVADGECVTVMGPSGCGKTTLLRLIAGLEAPTAGEIRIGGRCVNALPPHQRGVGMAFQRPALYPHLNVRQNLEFSARLRSGRALQPDFAKRLEETFKGLRLHGLLDRRPSELSGGERQRVALGRLLLANPPVLLLDEPLGQLEESLRLELRRDLRAFRNRAGSTILHVTHDRDEACSLGDRIVVLREGLVRQIGTPRELHLRPASRLVANACARLPISYLDGELREVPDGLHFQGADGSHTLIVRKTEWLPFVGRAASLGIPSNRVCLLPDESKGPWRIVQVESLGDLSLAVADWGDWTLEVVAPSTEALAWKGACMIAVDWDHVYLFERPTGVLLAGPAP